MRRAVNRAVPILSALTLIAVATPGEGQGWSLEARAGQLDFGIADDIAPAATSLGLTLGHEARDGWLRLSTGVPLGEEDPVWGAADIGQRVSTETGPLTLGMDLSAQGFLQRYRQGLSEGPGGPLGPVIEGEESWGSGLAVQALPLASVDVGPATLRGRAGVSWYRSALADRSATRTVGLGDMRLSVRTARWLTVAAEGRHYETEEGGFTFGGVAAVLGTPGISLWGSVGHWFAIDSLDAVPWSAGARVALAERLDLTLDAREDALDPVYASAPRRAWGVGLRLRLGPDDTPRPPVPAEYRGGRATITLPTAESTEEPRIAGDFNDWTPAPMRRDGNRWSYTTALEPGVYEYAFVAPDGTWFVPESVPGRVEDGMGGHVARLVVEEAD